MTDSPHAVPEPAEGRGPIDAAMRSATLVDLLRWRSRHQGDRLSYRYLSQGGEEQVELTYGELDRRARAIAARLQQDGAKGDRALLLYPPGPEFIVGFFGCLFAGVIAVPAYPPRRNHPDRRIGDMAADCEASFALTTAAVGATDVGFGERLGPADLRWVATDEVASDLAAEWRRPVVDSGDLAILQYTSGSTSRPKGVMVSHGNVFSNSVALDEALVHDSASVILSWLPHFHDMGLIYGLLHPVYRGCLGVQMSPASFIQQPFRWLEALSRHRATHSGGPNFCYDLCVSKVPQDLRNGLDLSSWRVAFNGAEPVRRETLMRFFDAFGPCGLRWASLRPCYGLAEATLKVTFLKRHEEAIFCWVRAADLERGRVVQVAEDTPGSRALVGCGSAAADTGVLIVDPESLNPCASDEVGEIWVSGSSVAQGYWNRVEATRETFGAHPADSGAGPYLRTGDLGFLSHGQLFVTGRIKDLIIIRGFNHYPQDIELTVEKVHPALRLGCGAAFAVDRAGEERLVVVQELHRHHRDVDLEELLQQLRAAVTKEHLVEPDAVLLLQQSSLDRTSSGKVQRFAARQRYLENRLQTLAAWRAPTADAGAAEAAAPRPGDGDGSSRPSGDDIRVWLVARISRECRLAPRAVDLRRPFAQFGLDSLRALALVGDLERWLGRRLPATMLWNFPTIDALATELARESDPS